MDRSLIGHGALAIAAVVAAYVAWVSPSLGVTGEEGVTMIAADAEDVTRVRWHEEDFDVTLSRRESGGFELKVDSRREADGPSTKIFPASDRAEELVKSLAPLEAERSLGKAEPERLAELGLDAPRTSLTLELGDDTHEIALGNATYGSGDTYTLGPDGEVYLIRSTLVSSLKRGAPTLQERQALAVERERITRVEVSTPTGSREVVQRYGEDEDKAFFADTAVPDEKLPQVSNWMDRVLKLRIADVTEEKPSAAPALTVELFDAKGSIGKLQLWSPGEATALAQSTFHPETVTVTKANAEAILRDVQDVLQEGK